ncbi:MAG: class I SAM-dependent methyltransferase [Elusimicrobiaceae bacterium]|nr:class I SAM-dependent methyltransferase [Elusimicrobiaceae bacterium]
MIKVKKNWPRGFFDKVFYEPSSVCARKRAGLEAEFFARALGLKRGMSVLDVACGQGRHSVLLAGKGLAVTGVDVTRAYLDDARAYAKREGVNARFVRTDMRKLAYSGEFDGALCAFTSFGYFDRKTNFDVLKRIFRALKPGGRFVIDVISREYLERYMEPRDWFEMPEGGFLLEEHEFDARAGRVRTRMVRILENGRIMDRAFGHIVYGAEELKALLLKAGFEPLKSWKSFTPDAPVKNRAIVLVRRPDKSV